MKYRNSLLVAAALAATVFALPQSGFSQQSSAPAAAPDLNGFWTHGFSLGFDPPPEGGPGPVHDKKTKAQMRAMGQFLVHDADTTNPILQPWAAAEIQKANDAEKRGSRIPSRQEICFPSGVPNYWTHPLLMQVVQTKDYVVFLHARDHQIRIVHLNKPHAPNPQPSWYGDSVGHFEGDTLVVDTIGLNDKTPIDTFHTPHTTKEHVVERIRVVPGPGGSKNLEVRFTVDDPGAFTMPWTGIETYRGVGGPGGAVDPVGRDGLLDEEVCAENNHAIGIPDTPIPTETAIKFR
jgi:hypothetical protein